MTSADPAQCESPKGIAVGWVNHPILDASWDRVVYVCVASAVLTAAACAVLPRATELSAFGWLMFLTNTPAGIFLPSAAESLVIVFGRLYPATILAAVGVGAVSLVEWLNYRLFGAVMLARTLTPVRSAWITRHLETLFAIQPFATTVLSALTPVPFWVARVCAVCSGYAVGRFILATALGRFARYWVLAFLGTALSVRTAALLLVAAFVVILGGAVAARAQRRWPVATGMARTAGPMDPSISNQTQP